MGVGWTYLENLPGADAASAVVGTARGHMSSAIDINTVLLIMILMAICMAVGIWLGRLLAVPRIADLSEDVGGMPPLEPVTEPEELAGDSGLRRRRPHREVEREAEGPGVEPGLQADGFVSGVESVHRPGGTVRVRTVQTQSQTRYKFWRKEPRFEPYCGSADGTLGFFAVGRLLHDAGDE